MEELSYKTPEMCEKKLVHAPKIRASQRTRCAKSAPFVVTLSKVATQTDDGDSGIGITKIPHDLLQPIAPTIPHMDEF